MDNHIEVVEFRKYSFVLSFINKIAKLHLFMLGYIIQ